MKKKVGLFGGTFNPIHFGHINLTLELKERQELDEVWFIPSLLSPLRMQEPLIDASHRLNMLKLALEDIPGYHISTLELDRPPPSFTIDTVREILASHRDKEFYLLFGEDSLLRFAEWKEPLELVRLIPLLIGSRRYSNLLDRLSSLNLDKEIAAAIQKGIFPTRQFEISATEIRERLKKNLYCGHFLPRKVLDYIKKNQLYYNVVKAL